MNIYMRSLLLLTLQAKSADYRRQVDYHHLWLSLQPVRRLSVGQREGRWRHARHPVTAQAARAGAPLKAPSKLWAIFNVALRPTTACHSNLSRPVDTGTAPNKRPRF